MPAKRRPEELPDPKQSMWDLIAVILRYQRNQRGLSGDAMGRIIGASKSTVSRLETGDDRMDSKQAAAIDKAWDTGKLYTLLVWYAAIGHDPQWFAQYIGFEQRAGFFRIYEAGVIPGLFQTEDYMRALLSVAIAPDPDKIFAERSERQNLLHRQPAPQVAVVLSQNALDWPVGSPEIMRAQLAYLLELAEQPHIAVRVLPRTWSVGAHAGMNGAFFLLHGDDFGEVAYAESNGAGRLVSAPSEVREYGVKYERISAKALDETASADLIRRLMEDYK